MHSCCSSGIPLPMCCRSKETDHSSEDIEHCSSIQRSPSLSTERVYQEYRIIFSPDYLVNCQKSKSKAFLRFVCEAKVIVLCLCICASSALKMSRKICCFVEEIVSDNRTLVARDLIL
jgi:hypothetical protein